MRQVRQLGQLRNGRPCLSDRQGGPFNSLSKCGELVGHIGCIKWQIRHAHEGRLPDGIDLQIGLLQAQNVILFVGCRYVFAIDVRCLQYLAQGFEALNWITLHLKELTFKFGQLAR